ncbi:MAG: UDP-N-acetylglucosamine acyltransferase [Saccharothrix sp.]|nr:UDP-N-acetylglucosamine acyltransferase [Saccharothrix sp.]
MANRIHPTAVIGDGVELGDDNVIGPYTVIVGPTRIGDGNYIGPHASIGGPAEHVAAPHPAGWDGETAGEGVVIGSRNRIREFVCVSQGHAETTRVGDDCYLMGRSHVAHDCVVGDGVVLTSSVQLAGHCRIWSGANLGLGTVVHQRTSVGPGAMVGMGSVVTREIGAFTKAYGVPARVHGVNSVGLQRRGCSDAAVAELTGYLLGEREAYDADLPDEVAALLKAWAARH